jgi:raffinose/stachyose/melibiose transport system permease protein
MLALPIIGYLVFTVYPVLWTFAWSLYSYNGVAVNARFVGWENFATMLTKDFTYWRMWGNTLLMAVMKMPVELSAAMILAVILSRRGKASGFFRSVYYLPSVISIAVVGLVFSNLFSYFGVFNGILMRLGVIEAEVDWFSSKALSLTALTLAGIWNTFGVNVMYLLAALTNVPAEVYESAALDGASGGAVFFRITLPMIAPVFRTVLLLSLIGTLSVNEIVLVLTNGAPGGQSFSVMSYLTRQFVPGFISSHNLPPLGYGCAMSAVTTVLFAVIAFVYSRVSGTMDENT